MLHTFRMIKIRIKIYYKIFGYLNLILGVLFIIISPEIELMERIFGAISFNAAYHMLYLFYSTIYRSSYNTLMHNEFNKKVGGILTKGFAIFGMICSFFILFIFIFKSIELNEYSGFCAICVPIGLFLGAYSLWLDMNSK